MVWIDALIREGERERERERREMALFDMLGNGWFLTGISGYFSSPSKTQERVLQWAWRNERSGTESEYEERFMQNNRVRKERKKEKCSKRVEVGWSVTTEGSHRQTTNNRECQGRKWKLVCGLRVRSRGLEMQEIKTGTLPILTSVERAVRTKGREK